MRLVPLTEGTGDAIRGAVPLEVADTPVPLLAAAPDTGVIVAVALLYQGDTGWAMAGGVCAFSLAAIGEAEFAEIILVAAAGFELAAAPACGVNVDDEPLDAAAVAPGEVDCVSAAGKPPLPAAPAALAI